MAELTTSGGFWAGKRVFLTGHTGFKGSWLAQWLVRLGAEVCGYALAPSAEGVPAGHAPLFDELGLAGALDHRIGDVRDRAALGAALGDFAPEIVIHMAAQALVRPSYRDPVETYATNVMGTVNLLDACRALPGLRTVLIVTSDKCYENREQIWGYREGDAMGGHDPYSNSKGCAELVTAAFRASFFPAADGVVICSGRAGNVIGGGDWSIDRLVPDAMRAFLVGEALTIRNPGAVRPWQHVIDPLSGYMALVEASYHRPALAAAGWNFGPGDEMNLSVAHVADLLRAELGEGFAWIDGAEPGQLHEANLLRLDCTAARTRLGWRPVTDAATMLAYTAAWYRERDPATRRALLLGQLAAATG